MSDVTFDQVYDLAMKLSPEERRRLVEHLNSPTATLTAEAILETLNERENQLRKMGVKKIGLFGSHILGEPQHSSDIDILVTLEQPTFKDYMRIKLLLEDLFACKVDLVPEDSLREELRARN